MTTQQHLALFVDVDGAGSHPASWRVVDAAPAGLLTAAWTARTVTAAERAGFTAVVFDDHPLPPSDGNGPTARLDAVIRASFTAPITGAIGLIPVVHALYNEPFHVAVQIASVDTASKGRAGWVVAADPDPAIAARHGREPIDPADVDGELSDVVEVARRLWDSWEDDAVIRDVATGRYLDRDRLHYVDFTGRRFSVKGPSILPRSPQGQPVVVGNGPTSAEVDLAPVDLEVILDRAGRSAADRLAELDGHETWADTGRRRYVGDAAGLVETILELAATSRAVRLRPAVVDADIDEIGRAVLPTLRSIGAFRSPRTGETLRNTLGLGRAANRFAGAAR